MRLAYITAGAAGMYCGSCIHDNALAAALAHRDADVALIPTYTPLRTDEENVSLDRVFYGGVNIFLQQQWSFFRRTHRLFDRVLDSPLLIRTLAHFGSSTNARDLGPLTVSILAGEDGNQQKELTRLVAWLQRDFKPDLIQLTNAMFVGMARQLKAQLGVPVLCALQGEDLFLDGLPEPSKTQALKTLRQRAQDIDAFIAPCAYYQEYMSEYLQVPQTKIHVVPLGLNLTGHGQEPPPPADGPYKIGYLARICPEKGFHLLVDAFQQLKEQPEFASLRLEAAGYLSAYDKPYFAEQVQKIRRWGLADSFAYHGAVDRHEKIRFLSSLHVFSVPSVYADPKGLPVLEALANGIPVIQPDHGAFPELIAATGGGLLVKPHSPEPLANELAALLRDEKRRRQLGQTGQEAVHRRFHADAMAAGTLAVYEQYL